MVEPAELHNFFTIFFSSAMVIFLGAAYALFFAASRLWNRPKLMLLAYLSYGGLFAAVLVLGKTANLLNSFFWITIVMLMLVGYLLAPHGIWHLCVKTHDAVHDDEAALQPVKEP